MPGSARVGVAASFTCDPLRRWLEFWLSELGLRVELAFAGYAQLGQELNRPVAYRGADGCVALLNFADYRLSFTPRISAVPSPCSNTPNLAGRATQRWWERASC